MVSVRMRLRSFQDALPVDPRMQPKCGQDAFRLQGAVGAPLPSRPAVASPSHRWLGGVGRRGNLVRARVVRMARASRGGGLPRPWRSRCWWRWCVAIRCSAASPSSRASVPRTPRALDDMSLLRPYGGKLGPSTRRPGDRRSHRIGARLRMVQRFRSAECLRDGWRQVLGSPTRRVGRSEGRTLRACRRCARTRPARPVPAVSSGR